MLDVILGPAGLQVFSGLLMACPCVTQQAVGGLSGSATYQLLTWGNEGQMWSYRCPLQEKKYGFDAPEEEHR